MYRIVLFELFALVGALAVVAIYGTPGDAASPRYTGFLISEGRGLWRLDTESGSVSVCRFTDNFKDGPSCTPWSG
jgi:hypothetical protein